MKVGSVLDYAYLWHREAAAGEDAGRKERPVCLALKLGRDPHHAQLFLFPITSQPPTPGRPAIAISQIECRRGGIYHPSWLIVDEFNHCPADEAYDFASTTPRGTFSVSFMRVVVDQIAELRRQRSVRGVKR